MRTLFSRCVSAGGGDLVPNYGNPQRGDPDIILPATGTSLALAYGAGAWGAYKQIVAATPAALALALINWSKIITVTGSHWVEIATGAAGAEVPLCYVGEHGIIAGAGSSPIVSFSRRVGPYTIPAGTRVAARGWVTGGGNAAGHVILSCFNPAPAALWVDPWPNTYVGGSRVTAPVRRDPAVAGWYDPIAITPNWTQIVAVAPNDMLLDAVEWDPTNGTGGIGNIMEIGVGAAGAEVVFARAAWPGIALFGWIEGSMLLGRTVEVLAGERVAARMVKLAGVVQRCAFYWEDFV